MMERKEKIFVATVVVLLLMLLVCWLSLGRSNAFFLIASCDAALVFLILIWVIVQHAVDEAAIIDAKKLKIFAKVLATLLLVLVILLCVRIGFSRTFYLIGSVDTVVILVFSLWSFFRRAKAHQGRHVDCTRSVSEGEEVRLESSYLRKVAGLPKDFRYEELVSATNNFQTRVGRGGSGSVFKGILADGSPIAVKRIEGEVRGEREFLSEISAMASVQHVNLVRLLGYCMAPRDGRFLVYEFIKNGSLDAWIFPSDTQVCLTWGLRYQVAMDVAKALAYLHHDCRLRILHLDVKPENILLDEDFRAHVSDFGISRLMGKDESRVLTTIRGTRGYLAPEWFSGEGISEKSDVYSYGMVLLELVGGRRNLRIIEDESSSDGRWLYFPKIVNDKMREGKLMEVVDERLVMKGREIEEREVTTLVYVALWCIQEKAELRPRMELVVDMLEGHVEASMPPETRMFMLDLLLPLDSQLDHENPSGTHDASALARNSQEIEHPLMSTCSGSMSTQLG